jgi:uncharacterized membrane protein SpoIIM required for sporulation
VNLSEFVTVRRPSWQETESLLDLAERQDLSSLSRAKALRLADLYRRASADLIQARTYGAGIDLATYLETLVARCYALLYQPPPLSARKAVWGFFRDGFPQAVRRERRAVGLVTAAFGVGLLLGGLATALDPEAARLFVPEEHQGIAPSERVRRDEEAQRGGKPPLDAASHAAFSSFLFTHNIQVSILCFAVGIAWGLPTLLFIAYHGVFIAALAAAYFQDGVGLFFLAWILPHGVIELTCILLAGAAGLLLGRGVLWPRGRPRAQRLLEESRGALTLLGGAAALLVVAGIIEGTVSQIHEPALPYPLKIGMALVLGALLHGYLWLLPLPREDDAHQMAPRRLSSR